MVIPSVSRGMTVSLEPKGTLLSLTPAFRPVLHDASLAAKAVSTAFLILPAQAMALNEFPKLIGERAHPMMFLLSGNVGTNLCDVGF